MDAGADASCPPGGGPISSFYFTDFPGNVKPAPQWSCKTSPGPPPPSAAPLWRASGGSAPRTRCRRCPASPAQDLADDTADLRPALRDMAAEQRVVKILPHAADGAVDNRPEGALSSWSSRHRPARTPSTAGGSGSSRERKWPNSSARHLAPAQVGLHDAVRPRSPGRQRHHRHGDVRVLQQAGRMEQPAGAVGRLVHPDADGVAGAEGPQPLRRLQILPPIKIRRLTVVREQSLQESPPGLSQGLPDVPHVQAQGQCQHVPRVPAQGDGLPLQCLLLPLEVPEDLADVPLRGLLAVVGADDDGGLHIFSAFRRPPHSRRWLRTPSGSRRRSAGRTAGRPVWTGQSTVLSWNRFPSPPGRAPGGLFPAGHEASSSVPKAKPH